MRGRTCSVEALADCSFDFVVEEALRRLYDRRLEIDRLLGSLDAQKLKSRDRIFPSPISRSIGTEDLSQAIERKQFVVYYQPKVSLRLRQLVGFEALVYWNHPQQGLIPPSAFIPLAEATGLMVPLGTLVLSQACRQLSLWRQEIPRAALLTMEIKLLPSQLKSDGTVDEVKRCLTKYKLPPEALHIALTESSVTETPELAQQFTEELNSIHGEVWLDGVTPSTYPSSQLRRYPLTGLKFDSSSLAATNSILALSRKLGFRVAADGIETVEEADELERLGCEFGQGALFSKPVPAGVATRFILADTFGLLGRSKHDKRQLANSPSYSPPLLA